MATSEAQYGQDTVLLSPQAMTAGATLTANHDTLNGDYSTIRFAVNMGATGTIASNNGVTVSLSTSDVTNATTFVAIANNSFTGINSPREILFQTDTLNQKRYLQLSVTTGTSGVTNENATVCAFGTLTNMAQTPSGTVAAPGLGGAPVTGTNDVVVVN
jgi:hypothetical protein